MAIDWRHQYDDERDALEREATNFVDEGPWHERSMTQQSFTEDADLNNIIKRFGIGDGAVPPAALDPSYFGDFTELEGMDLKTILDRTREVETRFQAMPANLRAKFDNSPAKLWKYINDPQNWDEAVELGMLSRQALEAAKAPGASPDTTKDGVT